MNWKNPKNELPEENQVVAILLYHWKENWPQSIEIYFGTARKYDNLPENTGKMVVENIDMIGIGCARWKFELEFPDSDCIAAWCDAKEFTKPDFLTHDNQWGNEFTPF